ncbi:MAG: DUF262 domain-containing protein [Mycoplasmataceae bacterium]|nr:DUF262 domain-containing protein [Mycoplasmataceae bacterium]
MKIQLQRLKIKDVLSGYKDDGENGLYAYDGMLNIRPPYQREFVYNNKQRDEVIRSILNNRPLNVMYWSKNKQDNYEIIDGQQRTISIGQFKNSEFSVKNLEGKIKYFHNFTDEEKEKFDNYELMIYVCEGTENEKLEWFKVINIAGEKLTDQELRNAIYSGSWLIDAKRYFSKSNCPASLTAKDYLKGSAIRQEYLETALIWISDKEQTSIEEYMAKHQNDKSASQLWLYFSQVIEWIKTIFKNTRKEMKGLPWGIFYNNYYEKTTNWTADEVEEKISTLMKDNEVTDKKGIYEYILSGNEKFLNLRVFDDDIKTQIYETQNGICIKCNQHFELNDMEGDHIKPWSEGGKTELYNCQLLCKDCNRRKSNK